MSEQQTQESVTFKLNGKDVTVPKGWTVMQAAKREDVKIPHFCWHPGLTVAGVCRFCMVKVEGRPKLEIACNLQATEGLEVSTEVDEVKEAHKWALEFHLVNHPLDCPICDQAGECGLQDYYMEVGKYKSQMDRPKVLKPKALKVGGDLVLDTERCILCSRCTRFEEEVTKTGALGIFDRGDRSIIGTYPGKKIDHNYTDNLVDICPVGAFTSKDFRFKQRVWFLEDKKSVCPGCSTGCTVNVFGKTKTRRFFRLKPRESEVNGHWMCDTGRQTYTHLNKEERLLFPYTSENGAAQKGSIEDVLESFKRNLDQVNPDQVALLVTAQYTNEEYAALFDYFVKERGVKKVYQWRAQAEDLQAFDGLLQRGDRNANTAGLLAAMKAHGVGGEGAKNQFDELAAAKPQVVVALVPELPSTFPTLTEQMEKLAELPYVSAWSVTYHPKEQNFGSMIPLKGYAEKTGTFTNYAGVQGKLEEAFPAAINDARSVTEIIDLLREI